MVLVFQVLPAAHGDVYRPIPARRGLPRARRARKANGVLILHAGRRLRVVPPFIMLCLTALENVDEREHEDDQHAELEKQLAEFPYKRPVELHPVKDGDVEERTQDPVPAVVPVPRRKERNDKEKRERREKTHVPPCVFKALAAQLFRDAAEPRKTVIPPQPAQKLLPIAFVSVQVLHLFVISLLTFPEKQRIL